MFNFKLDFFSLGFWLELQLEFAKSAKRKFCRIKWELTNETEAISEIKFSVNQLII